MAKQKGKHLVTFDHLRNISEQPYLKVAEQCCLNFQEGIRRNGLKSFNVYIFLEDEFRKTYIKKNIEHRKPPKASTISQWFSDDPISGTKLGTEDLIMICKIINDPTPLLAFYENSIKDFKLSKTLIEVNLKNLNSLMLRLPSKGADLLSEYDSDMADGLIDTDEANRIIAAAKKVIDHLNKIIRSIKINKKVS